MAIGTPVVGALNEQTSAGTTTAVAFPATVAANSVAYLFLTTGAAGLTTNPAGWTQLANLSGTGGTANPSNYVGRKVCTGTEGGTSVTVTHANAVNTGVIVVVPSGVNTTTPEDVTTVTQDNTSASTAVANAGATVVTAGSLGLYFTGNNTAANTSTATTGFTNLATRVAGQRAFEVSYKNTLATGATGALSDTYSGSGKSVTIFVVARAAVAATFSSATSTSFTQSSAGTFTVTTTGSSPTAVLTSSGTLPSGVTFTDNGNGTATLAGTPTNAGTFPLTFTATNVGGAPTQSFTLTVASSFTPLASEELCHALNRVAGTTALEEQGAANAWAGTTGLELLGALNAKNGTSGLGLLKVLNSLAGTTNLDVNGCARMLH